ncbi:MAG TPA: M28 family peptidase [Lentimicrobium sp.]|nr:M28 family peptidase [Lentimicrobium sp.]
MKRFCRNLLLVSLILGLHSGQAQLAYSPFVDSIAALSTNEDILLLERQLSGDTTVTVDGQVITINSRHYLSTGNTKATQFIFEKFEEYGYTPEIQYFNGERGANVIATKLGTTYPNQIYIICGHYDNMPSGPTAPGADDNASGTVATMEAARVLRSIDLLYTVKFIAWDEEEIGLVGSNYYAQQALANGEEILGVLNLDMIAWDSNDDLEFSIATNPLSTAFSNDFILTNGYYQPELSYNFIDVTASDHSSFWNAGYPALLAIEDWNDFNAFYHTPSDDIPILNMTLFGALVRASIANIASNALNQRFYFEHSPIPSGVSTEPRETTLVVTGDHVVDTVNYTPRLYYSSNGLTFNYLLPVKITSDTFQFEVPGFPLGTTVYYYFAVQDEDATMIATYPAGGIGISPPGTETPNSFLSYNVDYIFNNESCSENTPLSILDNSSTTDQIEITQQGDLFDLDVLVDITHPRTSELRIALISPKNHAILLSDYNGGEGDNYTQTVFDDEASLSIEEGTPPFTGHFRPEASLDQLDNDPIKGTWKIRVSDSGVPNSGTLNNWCLHLFYKDTTVIGVKELLSIPDFTLMQNYPNPAKSSTSIKLRLKKSERINLNLYDSRGTFVRTLAQGYFNTGDHLIVASISDLEPGTYYYTLNCDSGSKSMRMLIIK